MKPSKPNSQESRDFNHGSVNETKDDRLVDNPAVVAKAKAASEFLSSEGIGYAIMTGVDLKRYSRNHNLRSTLSCVGD